MKLPELVPGDQQVLMTTTFQGYNHAQIIQDGEMYDMENLSGDGYPLLQRRKPRGITSMDVSGQPSVPLTGIHGRDQLVYVRGGKVYYNNAEISGITLSTDSAFIPKKIVSFGAYVCIWPEKVYFNTTNLAEAGNMERLFPDPDELDPPTGEDVSLMMCRGDGTNYGATQITVDDVPPADPVNNQLWLDTSGDNDVLKQYSAATEEWVEVATTYVKISCAGIGHNLREYDTVDISGLEAIDGVSAKVAAQVLALNTTMIVYACGEDYIVVAGLISNSQLALKDQAFRIDRKVPDMDYVTESNNRLWGCKYGLVDGQVINEIRCSALGDFRVWTRFMGNSQDSYVASVGTDGEFTGAITQRGYPVFFKENCIHRVSGDSPSSFRIQTTMARGVQSGSWRSLAVVSENIYYKARNAVMVYDGNMPMSISTQLGEKLYKDARAGVMGNKYYISMADEEDQYTQFVYDTEKSIWHKEDGLKALGYGTVGDELYLIDEEHNTLVTVGGSSGIKETDIPWSATFGLYGTDFRWEKYLSRFDIRMNIEKSKEARLEIQYDSSGVWTYQGTVRGRNTRTFVLPVKPRRCDHLQFRISGTGDIRIYAISRLMEVGGDG